MKQKYTITVSDMVLNIVSDASADEVESIAAMLDRRMKEISSKSPRCTKSEAAILSALSYCSERIAMQEAFKKVEKDAFRYASENEKLKKTIERMQEELDNLRRDAQVMRTVLDRAVSEKEKSAYTRKPAPKKAVREATQLSAFDMLPEEESVQPTAPVPPAPKAVQEEAPRKADAPTEKKSPKKGKKDTKPKSHIGGMFDLLTFSDV